MLFQYPNVTDLLNTVGVKVEEIKSSPLKAAPSGFEPTSPEARAALESIVMDTYAWFRDLVKDRRQLDDAGLERVADGRVFTGRQAIELKLVDQIGGEDDGASPGSPRRRTSIRSGRCAIGACKPRFGDLSMSSISRRPRCSMRSGWPSLARRIEESASGADDRTTQP